MPKQNNDSNTLAQTKWNCKYQHSVCPEVQEKSILRRKTDRSSGGTWSTMDHLK